MNKTCPRCESKYWMTSLSLLETGDAMICVTRPTWREAAKGLTKLRASACADCGYFEFYAMDPKALWDEWRKQNA